MHVVITAYDAKWPALFDEEAAKIQAILGKECIDIHHIGSTAVKGLKAKPIIDIMPVVTHIEKVDAYNLAFSQLGYACMGEFGITNRRYFRKRDDCRTHHVHIFDVHQQQNILRHLAFRDYLRAHPLAAEAYGQLKERLACMFPNDIEAYCDGKDAFVKDLEQKALAWYQSCV